MGRAVKPARSGSKVPVGATRKREFASPVDKAKGYEIVWAQVSPVFEAARPIVNPSFVYFIGEPDDGPLKIGVSKDPIARLRQMQTGNPRRLRIEYVLVGDSYLEKLLHELWEAYAVVSPAKAGKPGAAPGTEWFTPEARSTLLPIVATAASAHVDHIAAAGELTTTEMERLVREAHGAHGFVANRRDEVVLLGRDAGTVIVSRHSYI